MNCGAQDTDNVLARRKALQMLSFVVAGSSLALGSIPATALVRYDLLFNYLQFSSNLNIRFSKDNLVRYLLYTGWSKR
jgi:hypothetical protein